MKKISLLLLASTILVFSCKKSNKAEQTSEAETEVIAPVVLTMQDIKAELDSSVVLANASWDSVSTYDNEKMSNIKRLLDEISYCDGANDKKLKKLFKFHQKVMELQYNQDNITSEMIDLYDNAQDSLINEVNALAESTPNIEAHPLAIELMDEIVKADGMTFSKRGDYDIWAKKINNAIKEYPEFVSELGVPYTNYKKLGIFGFDD